MRKTKRLFPLIPVLTLCSFVCSFMSILINGRSEAQEAFRNPPVPAARTAAPAGSTQTILDVRLEGNVQIAAADIMKIIKIRKGRPFSETVLEEDKRSLIQRTWFIDVKTKVERTPDGYIITFQFIERPLIHYVKVIGNHAHTKKALLDEANIKTGDAMDTIAVQQAAERIEQFYRAGGHHQVHVEILSGTQLGDRGVVFLVSEGGKQRVLSVEFEGNTIATGGRLKTLIQTKPGWFFWVNSEFTRKKLDEDVETLINYYRKLGFFYAKVDRVFEETAGVTGLGEPRNWVSVKFMIDEGPRCKIREIRFTGNNVFDQAALSKVMKSAKTKNGYYNQDEVEMDVLKIKELYGNQGYVFAMPVPDPRVDQDSIDLVINIKEGPRCYLNTLNVEIVGHDSSESYTKWHPILNRSSLRPGDILRTSEINATKRRLMASQLFNVNPTQGQMPEFIFDYPKAALEKERKEAEKAEEEEFTAEKPVIRGQAPAEPSVSAFSASSISAPSISAPAIYRPPMLHFAETETNSSATAAQTYPPAAYTYPYAGSVAPSAPPLQNPYLYPNSAQTPAQNPVAGMTAVQFSVPNPASSNPASSNPAYPNSGVSNSSAFLNPSAPAPVILGNPYSTLHEPATVRVDPNAPPGTDGNIYGTDAVLRVQEAQTGSLMMSVAVSSDSGLMGRFILEEQNFDILKFPRGYRFTDWKNAFRGKGQRFRIEAVPGTQVQRYSASWENPYFFDLDYSFGVSGFYYQRYYDEWYENRLGGTFSFGKLWTQDFSTRLSFGAQEVEIYRPNINLAAFEDPSVIGKHPMYTIGLDATHNTRDSQHMPTEGHLVSFGVEQVLGDYKFIRGNIDLRQYFMLRERPDRSGRWVLGLRSSLNVSDKRTPIYERYFGGGFTNLRGFEFRGVSPRDERGAMYGGCMEFYNSAELVFPLTADDMIRGSLFIDTGTVERSLTHWESKYRAAVGFGLRLTIPMMGPAPIALDFAFPLSTEAGDERQVFSFGMSLMR